MTRGSMPRRVRPRPARRCLMRGRVDGGVGQIYTDVSRVQVVQNRCAMASEVATTGAWIDGFGGSSRTDMVGKGVWVQMTWVSCTQNSPLATTAAPHSATVPKIDAPTAMRLRQAGVSTPVARRSGARSRSTGAASISIIFGV